MSSATPDLRLVVKTAGSAGGSIPWP